MSFEGSTLRLETFDSPGPSGTTVGSRRRHNASTNTVGAAIDNEKDGDDNNVDHTALIVGLVIALVLLSAAACGTDPPLINHSTQLCQTRLGCVATACINIPQGWVSCPRQPPTATS